MGVGCYHSFITENQAEPISERRLTHEEAPWPKALRLEADNNTNRVDFIHPEGRSGSVGYAWCVSEADRCGCWGKWPQHD